MPHIDPPRQTFATRQVRLYPRRAGHRRLETVLEMQRILYNAALQERRDAYRMAGVSVSLFDQGKQFTQIRADDPAWAALHNQIGRGTLRRLDRAFAAFFRRLRTGETPGYPRFKGRAHFRCIEVGTPTPNMVRRGAVRVKGLPTLRFRERDLPPSADLRALRLVRLPTGWYADLAYAVVREALPPAPASAVGIDVGVTDRLALSTGETVPRRESGHETVARLQRPLARKARGSRRRRKAVAALARVRDRERVRNRNECHRITTDLVRRFDLIAVEDLPVRSLTRSARGTVEKPGTRVAAKAGLNREVLAQTWGVILWQLAYKAEWAGRTVVNVPPAGTSQTCSRCGLRDARSRSGKTFACAGCGWIGDADVNAARVILQRAEKK